MSLPAMQQWSSKLDTLNTLFRQRNLCPLCHLPLVYNNPRVNPVDGSVIQDNDFFWVQLQSNMKFRVERNSHVFGTDPGQTNVERCHYVAASMVPEISRPSLYITPCVDHLMMPDSRYYLLPHVHRDSSTNQFFKWDMQSLCRFRTLARIQRCQDFLTLNSTRYFLACKDCNMAHTGTDQLKNIVNRVYNITTATGRSSGSTPDTKGIYSVYTLLYDSMRDYIQGGIVVTEERSETWQIELWLCYCCLMFLAQQERYENGDRYLHQAFEVYSFHNAHRDIGVSDFYISQVIAALLYSNFDIDVDFMWLHQNFLCYLPCWAHEQNLFKTPFVAGSNSFSYFSLWRMVMGKFTIGEIYFTEITDLAYTDGDQTYGTGQDFYFWQSQTNATKAQRLQMKIELFFQSWIVPLGIAIDARSVYQHQHPDFPQFSMRNQQFITFFRQKFIDTCVTRFTNMEKIAVRTINFPGHAIPRPSYFFFYKDPSLNKIEKIFDQVFPGHASDYLYEQMDELAINRCRVACSRTLANPGLGQAVTQEILQLCARMNQLVDAMKLHAADP